MRDYFGYGNKVRFVFPIDGDCINSADGKKEGNDITVNVKVAAAKGADIYVNGQKAEYDGENYVVPIKFTAYRTGLYAEDRNTGDDAIISVFKLRDPEKKFRLSSDDNIVFLKDITDHKDEYKSIFENPYLAMYKKVHDETGACVDINLFYEGKGNSIWGDDSFNLSQVTDKFKAEWEANSDWLRLSFHAKQEFPDAPYQYSYYEELVEDCKKVHAEIIRFAGEKTLSGTMTVHFAATTEQGALAVRNMGYKNLAGYFEFWPNGERLASYHYPKDLVAHVGERDFWRDTVLDITYTRIDRVLNLSKTVAGNLKVVKEAVASPTRGKFIELMIHEQYFYENYTNYIEKFGEIVLEACKYLKEQGYTGVFTQYETEE